MHKRKFIDLAHIITFVPPGKVCPGPTSYAVEVTIPDLNVAVNRRKRDKKNKSASGVSGHLTLWPV